MKRLAALVLAGTFSMLPALAQKAPSPFAGRWDFNTAPRQANWLGVTEKDGSLVVWFQATGGNVRELKEFTVDGNKMTLFLERAGQKNPALTWYLERKGDELVGKQVRGDREIQLTGFRMAEIKRNPPAAWSDAEPLFNGKDLTGWEPSSPTNNHWTMENGELVNTQRGANLIGTRKFDDFKVHFEVLCPDDANSGFYLRGRYEMQLEYEPLDKNPPERRIGSIYGRIAPNPELPRKPGQWETFDITLVGRTVTIVHNGTTVIDRKEIEGITGGALDANEGEPGVFQIQGDHTGGLRFRNVRIQVPKR